MRISQTPQRQFAATTTTMTIATTSARRMTPINVNDHNNRDYNEINNKNGGKDNDEGDDDNNNSDGNNNNNKILFNRLTPHLCKERNSWFLSVC